MANSLAARLKHKITFYEKIDNGVFEAVEWQMRYETFAEIIPLDAQNYHYIEHFNFGQVILESLYLFRIRYIQASLKNLRIIYKDRVFEIKKVTNMSEKNIIFNILAVEIFNA